jgi:hypothetical protein
MRIQGCWRKLFMSNLSEKDKHSPVVHTEPPTLDQTKSQQNTPSHPIKRSPTQEVKDDEQRRKTGTR